MKLIAITNDPDRACIYQAAGIDRVMVDLEVNGKEERQGHLDTLISRHHLDDISELRRELTTSELMVRTNPIFDGSENEIEDILTRGADRLMLPMFRHPDEVCRFLDMVDGRADVTLLVETAAAFARLPHIISIDAPFDIHIGLNDLHLEYKLDFMFELFTSGLLDHVALHCRTGQRAFGIGGIARVGEGLIPGEMVAVEHIRLGSSRVILSRDFSRVELLEQDALKWEVTKLREAFESAQNDEVSSQSEEFRMMISNVVDKKRNRSIA